MPKTQHELYLWSFCLTAGYILFAMSLDVVYRRFFRQPAEKSLSAQDWLFNGATFAGSVTIGMGIYDEQVMKVIGDTTPYLVLGCLVGLVYSLRALQPRK